MGKTRLLDLTRTLRRAGRTPTGIDRVERAYLSHFLNSDVDFFALARTPLGYLLVDRAGARQFHGHLIEQSPWPAADILSRLSWQRPQGIRQAETALRQSAVARCIPSRLSRMLAKRLGQQFNYYNVGHSNLTPRVMGAVQSAAGRVHVLIHDVIPLDHPEWQKPGTVDMFRRKIACVSALADRVIFNSHATQSQATPHLSRSGRLPPAIVAHLGVEAIAPNQEALSKGMPPDHPYFVTVGTIEPRKNHAFLLDLWETWGAPAPPLLICGARGWHNDAVFDRLDRLPPNGPVQEVSDLSDAALAYLIAGSAGLLFPSHAEGFGLPVVEAEALGARVLCNNLPVFREVASKSVAICPVSDSHLWLRTLKAWAETPARRTPMVQHTASTWADHFNTVLR